MEKMTTNSQNDTRVPLWLILIFLSISCNPGAKSKIECYGSPSQGYTVKAGEYFKWSDVAADTTKMKESARLYLLRQ